MHFHENYNYKLSQSYLSIKYAGSLNFKSNTAIFLWHNATCLFLLHSCSHSSFQKSLSDDWSLLSLIAEDVLHCNSSSYFSIPFSSLLSAQLLVVHSCSVWYLIVCFSSHMQNILILTLYCPGRSIPVVIIQSFLLFSSGFNPK